MRDALRSPLTVTCQLISGRKLRKTIMIPFTIAYQSLICFFQSLLSSSSFHTLTTTECNFPTYSLTFSLQRAKRANPLFTLLEFNHSVQFKIFGVDAYTLINWKKTKKLVLILGAKIQRPLCRKGSNPDKFWSDIFDGIVSLQSLASKQISLLES